MFGNALLQGGQRVVQFGFGRLPYQSKHYGTSFFMLFRNLGKPYPKDVNSIRGERPTCSTFSSVGTFKRQRDMAEQYKCINWQDGTIEK